MGDDDDDDDDFEEDDEEGEGGSEGGGLSWAGPTQRAWAWGGQGEAVSDCA